MVKVHEEIKSALGPDRDVNPNQIFVKLEALLHESSSVRVSKVVQDLISELQPHKTRSKSIEIESKEENDDAELEEMAVSENEDSHELDRDIILGDLILGKRRNVEDVNEKVLVEGSGVDSLRSTPASIISITDEDR